MELELVDGAIADTSADVAVLTSPAPAGLLRNSYPAPTAH
jgi:hypothetical protein